PLEQSEGRFLFIGIAGVTVQATAEGRFLSMGDGNPQMEATAEGRLYNHSPRSACLPGVSCGRRIYRRRAVV
uniref:hypothetical protein n=1 Tax=Candidatus Limisoma sp. TaxID=3076476 RepID=UPI004029CB53